MNVATARTSSASDETGTSPTLEASPAPGERTLFARPARGRGTQPDAITQRRRERLNAHAQRTGARREALHALLRSSALSELVRLDPQLKQDVARLMAFVLDDTAPG